MERTLDAEVVNVSGGSPVPLAGMAAALLAACGGGGGGDTVAAAPQPGGSPAPAQPQLSATDAARFLAQATLGSTKSEISALQGSSYGAWIEAQLNTARGQSHFDWLLANGYGADTFANGAAGLDNTLWRKFIAHSDPLRQRTVLALSEILVVSVLGVSTVWRQFAVANYLDILETHAFGNYRQLLQDVTLSSAMGYYLTYRGNARANAQGSQPDENYARELMQLFTIGLTPLNMDGTARSGETYTPADVSGLARVFTGWNLDMSGLSSPPPPELQRRPMTQVAGLYETGAKTFMGVTIPAGTPALAALNTALDTLFAHPNVPPFIGRQLIQRLVTSNPSPAYVGRVAAAFADNGAGVRGDMKAVLRAILLDAEARDATMAGRPTFGKLREPVVRFLNWARAFGATSQGNVWNVGDLSDPATRLGQSPMRSASVFNFFRPGYVPPGSAIAQQGLAGPEFQITTESSVAGYVNFMQRVVAGQGVGDLRASHASLLALAGDSAALLAEINLVLAAGQLSAATLATLRTALDSIAVASDAGRNNRVQAALILVLASPEYIVQR